MSLSVIKFIGHDVCGIARKNNKTAISANLELGKTTKKGTSIAAAGLVIIMLGATVVSAIQGPVFGALVPGIVGTLAFYVVRGRWESVPQRARVYQSTPALRRAA